jgi:hypothetical protein
MSFVENYFDSIEQIEALSLLVQNPDRTWTADEVNHELRSSPRSLLVRLETLHGMGALQKADGSPPRFQFKPRTPETESLIAELLEAYRTRRIAVINLIYSRPPKALQSFADAFKLKKDESDG